MVLKNPIGATKLKSRVPKAASKPTRAPIMPGDDRADAPIDGIACRRAKSRSLDRAGSAPRQGHALLRAALDNLHQGYLGLDRHHRVADFNPQYEEFFGFPAGVVRRGATVYELVAAAVELGHYASSTVDDVHAAWLRRFEHRRAGRHEITLANGRTLVTAYMPTDDGGWVISFSDVSERIEISKTLAEQDLRFQAALTNMPHGLCMFDAEKHLILCNPAYAQLYALPPHLTRPGVALPKIIAHRYDIGNAPSDMARYFDVVTEAKEIQHFASRRVLLQDGRTIRITHNPMADGGYVATHEDVTAIVEAEARIQYLGTHDALTGLLNRVSFRERLGQALNRARGERKLAVLCLDLDKFKAVNDMLGHPIGDLLLMAVAERLTTCIAAVDTIARLGGDEFIILQGDLDGPQQASVLADRLVKSMRAPFILEGHVVSVAVSVGIAFCPSDGRAADELLKKADIALYRSKLEGRNTFRFFEPDMDLQLQARRKLEQELKAAMDNEDLQLHYQPLVEINSGKVTAFEALLRWDHPERGAISPLEFIPIAEETGLIMSLGAWVIRQACRVASTWPEDVRVAVNLSPLQFKDKALAEIVFDALAQAGLAASRLELEITESALLIDNEPTLAILHQLRARGVRIALDDFGTGYSSLSYLRSFPFDKLKIDKSFVRDMVANKGCSAIVRAVANLGAALGMTITAEGIESEEQLRQTREQGCTEVQGFIFSKPRPAAAVAEMLLPRRSLCEAADAATRTHAISPLAPTAPLRAQDAGLFYDAQILSPHGAEILLSASVEAPGR